MGTKICSECREEKELECFNKTQVYKGKIYTRVYCKVCESIKMKEYNASEKGKESKKRYYQTEKGRKSQRASSKRYYQTEKGRKMNLDWQKYNKQRCNETRSKRIAKLTDSYLAITLKNQFRGEITIQEIKENPQLIELKRISITNKRIIKNKTYETE